MTDERPTHIDLFTGLAGFSIAARANGIRTIAMCECDDRCAEFLGKAWPGVPVCRDVREFHWPNKMVDNSASLCEICKSIIDICGHHDDYNYPLKVRWLCKLHHFQWHKKNKPVPLLKPLPSMSHREIIALAHSKEANEKRSRTRRENKKGKCTPANGVFLLTAGVP